MSVKATQSFSDALHKALSSKPGRTIALQRNYDDWFFKQKFKDLRRTFLNRMQRVSLSEHNYYGPDLAVSKFVVGTCGGKVRDQSNRWITKSRDLPQKYDESFKICYIDASNSRLFSEAIDNFIDLSYLESIDLSKNPELDDFACDQLSRQFRFSRQLNEINLSYNPFISIYGLDILFRIPSLRRITAVDTLASRHKQIDLFKLAAKEERNCDVVT